jgi:hypothetical protein
MRHHTRQDQRTLRLLREFVRGALSEGPAGVGVTADPTNKDGAYPYEVERGADIHGYWYRSPGDQGSGDPGRPDDPEEYIGIRPPAGAAAPETGGAE